MLDYYVESVSMRAAAQADYARNNCAICINENKRQICFPITFLHVFFFQNKLVMVPKEMMPIDEIPS